MYISNRDSMDLHPSNTCTDFTVQLPKYLELDSGNWECGVVQCVLPTQPDGPIYVTADFVTPSLLGGQLHPVLCSTTSKRKEFQHVTRVPLNRQPLESLRIKVVNTLGVQPDWTDSVTYIVLQFRKKTA